MTKYNQVTPEIAAQLQAIVGAKRFFAGDAVKDDFSHDEMPIYGKYYPEVVCEAESTEEVSAILRVCYDNNIPVTPRGAGTGLVGVHPRTDLRPLRRGGVGGKISQNASLHGGALVDQLVHDVPVQPGDGGAFVRHDLHQPVLL